MEEVVRQSLPPTKSAGFRASSTLGVNTDTPQVSFGEQGANTPTAPYARLDQYQDWSRWPQLRELLSGGQEIASAWRDVSNAIEIDPNACNIWLLRCHSASLAISFSALDALPAGIAGSVFASAIRVTTVQIIIDWQAAASGSRTLTLSSVLFPDSEAPDWTIDAGVDVLAVQVFSNGLLIGKDIGLAMGVPS